MIQKKTNLFCAACDSKDYIHCKVHCAICTTEYDPFRKARKILNLPRIKAPILWVHDYYDGPLSGTCWIEGEGLCWFELDPSLKEPGRRHLIYKLTDEEFRVLVERHLEFEMYVGTHYCNHAKGPVKDRSNHHLFYDKHYQRNDYVGDKEPIGKLIRV